MPARFTILAPVLAASVIAIAGCDRSSESSRAVTDLEKRVEAMEKRVQQLEAARADGRPGATTTPADLGVLVGTAPAEGASTPADATADLPAAAATGENDPGSQPVVPPTAGIEVVANPELKGVMGRLIVEFPADAKTDGTQVAVNKAGEKTKSATDYGNMTAELLPGQYELVIAGARVGGAEVKSRHDTRVPVGVLRITTSDTSTTVAVLSADGSQQFNTGYGSRDVGLPAGKYMLKVAGQTAPVEIKAGEVTEF